MRCCSVGAVATCHGISARCRLGGRAHPAAREPYAPPTHHDTTAEVPVPTGQVNRYDTEKGFGFLTRDDGGDVFVHRDALPQGVPGLKPGSRVEFGIVEGRRGERTLTVKVLDDLEA
jgi:cold shock CspA family protein